MGSSAAAASGGGISVVGSGGGVAAGVVGALALRWLCRRSTRPSLALARSRAQASTSKACCCSVVASGGCPHPCLCRAGDLLSRRAASVACASCSYVRAGSFVTWSDPLGRTCRRPISSPILMPTDKLTDRW